MTAHPIWRGELVGKVTRTSERPMTRSDTEYLFPGLHLYIRFVNELKHWRLYAATSTNKYSTGKQRIHRKIRSRITFCYSNFLFPFYNLFNLPSDNRSSSCIMFFCLFSLRSDSMQYRAEPVILRVLLELNHCNLLIHHLQTNVKSTNPNCSVQYCCLSCSH